MNQDQQKLKSIVKKVMIAAVIIIVAVPISFVIYFFIHLDIKNRDLQKSADEKQKTLSSITIIDGRTTEAKGVKSGDGLTGNMADINAVAEFELTGNLASVADQVRKNLAEQAFNDKEKPLPDGGEDFRGIGSVVQTFFNQNNKITVRYVLLKDHIDARCPNEIICSVYSAQHRKPNDKREIFDVNKLANEKIKQIKVEYK